LGNEFRLIDRYELQGELVQALENTTHHRHLAEKVHNCHKKFRRKRCDGNHDWATADNSCSVRICPHCSHRRSKILAARMQTFLVGKTELRYAVLAERSSENCEAGILSLWKAWTSLRRSVCWKRKVKGCIAVLEVTYNAKDKTFHPHLNVLMEGEYFPFEELNQAWIKATEGNGQTSFIRAADENTVFELIKYVTKIADLLEHAAALDEFLSAVYGSRIVRTYGTFRSMKTEDEENPGEECPDCGSTCIVDLGRVRTNQLAFDFEKQVFRVRGSPPAAALIAAIDFSPWKFAMDGFRRPDSVGIALEARTRATRYEKQVRRMFRKNEDSLRQPAA
jgi:hypothetical protein